MSWGMRLYLFFLSIWTRNHEISRPALNILSYVAPDNNSIMKQL